MSSRATKKKVWRLKNMTNGNWLNMVRDMDLLEQMKFREFCYKYGLASKYESLNMTGTRRVFDWLR